MDLRKNYSIRTEGGTLTFSTASFRAEKSSFLHSGVYNKEFMSILFASGICMLLHILLSPYMRGAALYIVLVSALALVFLLSRRFIFSERRLELILDRKTGMARIIIFGTCTKKMEEIAIGDITDVVAGSRRFEPQNMDGAEFVQKISVQHGSAVPGLGEVEEFVTLSLRLHDGSERLIYAVKLEEEPDLPVREIRDFIS